MHLVEAQSAATRLRISKMEIQTRTFPMPFVGKYVVIITSTGAPAKNYLNWKIVTDWLKPALNAAGYVLVQCGGEKDERIGADHDICGKTSSPQYFEVIKNASLVLCGDTSAVHVAGHFDVPLVALFSISSPSVSRAYFGNPLFQRYLVPEKYKPTYDPNENPPAINSIAPERIIKECCGLLKIKTPVFQTLHTGGAYALHAIEIIPNVILRPDSLAGMVLNIRFDKGGVERAVYDQLALRKCSISTLVPLHIPTLKALRANIDFIAYEITENHSVEFVTAMTREQIPFRLFTKLSEEKLGPIKLDYFDLAVINRLESGVSRGSEWNDKKFRTNRKILSNSRVYLSYAHVAADKSVDKLEENEDTVIDAPDFWCDKELFYIYA